MLSHQDMTPSLGWWLYRASPFLCALLHTRVAPCSPYGRSNWLGMGYSHSVQPKGDDSRCSPGKSNISFSLSNVDSSSMLMPVLTSIWKSVLASVDTTRMEGDKEGMEKRKEGSG